MAANGSAALDAVPLKMLQAEGEAALKKIQSDRRAHGKVLERAGQIAGLSKKEVAAALDVSPSQLAAWFAGTEHQQTWRFQQHPTLKRALLAAQAEDVTGVVPTLTFSIPMDFPAKKESA